MTNRPVVTAILAVLAVPFGIAVIEDIGRRGAGTGDEAAPALPDGEDRDGEAGAPGEPTERMDRRFFETVFLAPPGDRPGLAGSFLGDVQFGMTPGAVEREAPELWRWSDDGHDPFPGASVALEFADDRGLSSIAFGFPDDGSAVRILAAAWGPPQRIAQGQDDESRSLWFVPDAGLRVSVMNSQLRAAAEVVFEPYLPLARLHDPRSGFAFETRGRILGAEIGELVTRYGEVLVVDPTSPDKVRIAAPPTELSRRPTACTVSLRGGRAIQLVVVVDHGLDMTAGPETFAALRAQLGEPISSDGDERSKRWSFAGGIDVEQSQDTPEVVLRMR